MTKLVFTAFSLILYYLSAVPRSHGFPLTYEIDNLGMECLYEKLEQDEYVSMSVFILNGPRLRALAHIEGPVAPVMLDDSVYEMIEHLEDFEKGKRYGIKTGHVKFESRVDFEHPYFVDRDDKGVKPWQKTIQVVSPGWYKFCVLGTFNEVSEFEFLGYNLTICFHRLTLSLIFSFYIPNLFV